jgi:hypothetical protein
VDVPMSATQPTPPRQPKLPKRYALAILTLMILPFSGVLARLSTAQRAILAGIGIALWTLAILVAALSLHRLARSAGISLTQHLLVWTFEFAALYFLSVAVTGAILKR